MTICLMISILTPLLLINMNVDKLKTQLKIHEGYRREVYMDTTGNRTVGIGFNLERMDAPAVLKMVGADYHEVVTGAYILSREQIEQILDIDIEEFEPYARDLISNYDELDEVRQRVVMDMIFNLGVRGFGKFVNTRKHIVAGNYDKAASNMMRSLWAKQVKGRARILSEMMRNGEDVYDL